MDPNQQEMEVPQAPEAPEPPTAPLHPELHGLIQPEPPIEPAEEASKDVPEEVSEGQEVDVQTVQGPGFPL